MTSTTERWYRGHYFVIESEHVPPTRNGTQFRAKASDIVDERLAGSRLTLSWRGDERHGKTEEEAIAKAETDATIWIDQRIANEKLVTR